MARHSKPFWTKVDIPSLIDCWIWTGALTSSGYGHFRLDGRDCLAHRYCFQSLFGEIPEGMQVLHKCDNPRCVNPSHLFLGTHEDNMRDMVNKGRSARGGERHNGCKLSRADVILIRSLSTKFSPIQLASMFPVTRATISRILRRETWKHL